MGLLNKKFEASEKNKAEHLRHYEDAINDKKKLVDEYTCRITNLRSQCSSFEERCSSLLKAVESATRESLEWKRKYEQISSKQKAEEDNTSAEIVVLQSRISATNARLAAAREQVQSAEEATEWKRKFDIAARETKAAMEKAVTVQERASKQTQLREDVLRAEFSSSLVGKDEEIKDKVVKIENVEQRLTTAVLELKAAKSKMRSYDLELSAQKFEIKELVEKLDAVEVASQSFEREAKIQEQEKTHLE